MLHVLNEIGLLVPDVTLTGAEKYGVKLLFIQGLQIILPWTTTCRITSFFCFGRELYLLKTDPSPKEMWFQIRQNSQVRSGQDVCVYVCSVVRQTSPDWKLWMNSTGKRVGPGSRRPARPTGWHDRNSRKAPGQQQTHVHTHTHAAQKLKLLHRGHHNATLQRRQFLFFF